MVRKIIGFIVGLAVIVGFPVGVMAQDNYSQTLQGKVNYIEHGSGGHYYVKTGESSLYMKAHMIVDLSQTKLNTVNGKRVAYVSFNAAHFDIGLRNDGNGWSTYYVDFQTKLRAKWTGNEMLSPSKVSMDVRVYDLGNKYKVKGYFVFYGKSGKPIKTTIVEYTQSGNYSKVSFDRFVSLVPNYGEKDVVDGSYLKNVKISDTKLFNGSKSVKWTIGSTNVAMAWLVQPKNISVTKTATGENSSIAHNYSYSYESKRVQDVTTLLSTKTIPSSRSIFYGDVSVKDYLVSHGKSVTWDSATGNILVNGVRLLKKDCAGFSTNGNRTYAPKKILDRIIELY